jgi:hypothetical protein
MKKEWSLIPYYDDEFLLSPNGLAPTCMHGQPAPQMVQVTFKHKFSVRQDQHITCLHIKVLANHQYPITWMPHWVFIHKEKKTLHVDM